MTNDECLRPSSFRPLSREAEKRSLRPRTVYQLLEISQLRPSAQCTPFRKICI